MTIKRTFLVSIIIIVGLFILRIMFLPEPVKNELILQGFSNKYFIMETDTGVIDEEKIFKTIIYKGFFSLDKRLDKSTSQEVVRLIQDSSNYSWDKEKISEFEKRLIFYDESGDILGETKLSYSGQSSSTPTTQKISKWGMLNEKGLKKLLILIE
jgi:hypothetical protein